MLIFARAQKQGQDAMHAIHNGKFSFKSVGTYRIYKQALTQVAQYLKEDEERAVQTQGLQALTVEQAEQYLLERAEEVGQSSLDIDRKAMQCLLRTTGALQPEERLKMVKTELDENIEPRAYTKEQIEKILDQARIDPYLAQRDVALSIEIVHAAGLRAHELFELRRPDEQPADLRPKRDPKNLARFKFEGRTGVIYTTKGKGGLIREVLIPHHLAERLEAKRLDTPKHITDRTIHRTAYYDLCAGKALSSYFTKAATDAGVESNGIHGLRHNYAQERMKEIEHSHSYKISLGIVSQEVGHFRPSVTEGYLRT